MFMTLNLNLCIIQFFQMANARPLSHKKEKRLIWRRRDLIEHINLSAPFWAALVKHGVLLHTEVDDIRVCYFGWTNYM